MIGDPARRVRPGILAVAMMAAALLPPSPAPAADPAAVGGGLYRDRCMNCHGRNGEAKALGRSRPLATLEAPAIRDRLERARTAVPTAANPGPMPSPMQDRIKAALTADEVEALVYFLNIARH